MSRFHVSGHLVFPYIDDMFDLASQRTSAILARDACLQRFLYLGFIIIRKKSSFMPTQDLTHLGGHLLTGLGHMQFTGARATSVAVPARSLQTTPHISRSVLMHYWADDGVFSHDPTLLAQSSSSDHAPTGSLFPLAGTP